jgi:diguanylate cyclase (GGDEF)-like protein
MRVTSGITARYRQRVQDSSSGEKRLTRRGAPSARVMQLLGRVLDLHVLVCKLAVQYDDCEPSDTDVEALQAAIQELARSACLASLNTFCSVSLRVAERTEPMRRAGCLPRRALLLLHEWLALSVRHLADLTDVGCAVALVASLDDPRWECPLYPAEREVLLCGLPGIEAALDAESLAGHDWLTGLPNGHLLEQCLDEALAEALETGDPVAVLLLGLDRFKNINDSFGDGVGDGVLREIATLLVQAVGGVGTVGRHEGDQFAIVLGCGDAAGAARQAEALLGVIATTLEVDGHDLPIRATMGVAMFPKHGRAAAVLLANATVALNHAKATYRSGYRFFAKELREAALARITLEAELGRAIDRNELELHYQPKLCVHTGRLRGAEALLRWRSPSRGVVSPAEFIPLAEDCRLILPLSDWVINEACRQLGVWQRGGGPSIPVAINVSPTLLRANCLITTIRAALTRHGVAASLLEVEITESAAMHDIERSLDSVRALAQLGLRIAVDDFGIGYSNLSLLALLPLAMIKIDRSLVGTVAKCPRDAAIVRAIIDLAHSLGLRVVAEGVESSAQLALLRAARCDDVQGYLMSKPLAPVEFAQWARLNTEPRPET